MRPFGSSSHAARHAPEPVRALERAAPRILHVARQREPNLGPGAGQRRATVCIHGAGVTASDRAPDGTPGDGRLSRRERASRELRRRADRDATNVRTDVDHLGDALMADRERTGEWDGAADVPDGPVNHAGFETGLHRARPRRQRRDAPRVGRWGRARRRRQEHLARGGTTRDSALDRGTGGAAGSLIATAAVFELALIGRRARPDVVPVHGTQRVRPRGTSVGRSSEQRPRATGSRSQCARKRSAAT